MEPEEERERREGKKEKRQRRKATMGLGFGVMDECTSSHINMHIHFVLIKQSEMHDM